MYIGTNDTKTQTIIQFIGARTGTAYIAAKIYFADNFDHNALPKSVCARKMMTIDCTPRKDNAKNEAGLKRLHRILAALEGTSVVVDMPYANSITKEEFFALVG